MSYFKDIIHPKPITEPFFTISELDSYFYESDQPPETENMAGERELEIGTPLVLLEQSIGYEGLWDKVQIFTDKRIGYVRSQNITSLIGAKPKIIPNTLSIYLPDSSKESINWREEKTNVLIKDYKRGMYSVSYDTEIEVLQTNIQDIMNLSLYAGLSIILKDIGKKYDLEYIKSLQDSYYFFGVAEEVYSPMRKCSTIRVLVSLPMRFAHSDDILDKDDQPEDNSDPLDDQKTPPNTVDIIFNSRQEFDTFFNDIDHQLNIADTIYQSRRWYVEPSYVSINFSKIKEQTKIFITDIEKLIFENIKLSDLAETTNLEFSQLENYKNWGEKQVEKFSNVKNKKIFSNFIDYTNWLKNKSPGDPFLNQNPKWEGSVKLKINLDEECIYNIYFYSTTKKNIPLNRGLIKFLTQETVKSKTILAFIINRHLSKVKQEFIGAFYSDINFDPENYIDLSKEKNTPDNPVILEAKYRVKNSLDEQYGGFLNHPKFLSWLNDELIIPRNNEDMRIDTFMSLGNAGNQLQAIGNSLGAIFGYGSSRANGPEQLFNFWMVNYYYPKIENISAEPLDISQCIDNFIHEIDETKENTIQEIKKFNKLLESDRKNQIEWEGSDYRKLLKDFPFGASADQVLTVVGIKKLPDNLKWHEKINQYIKCLKELNITAYMAESLRCAFTKLDPQTLTGLLEKYNVSKKILEDILFSTACSPFLAAPVNFIQGIQFPEFVTVDPNRNLRKQLEEYAVKFVEDLFSVITRETLKSIMKHCLADASKEQNAGSAETSGNRLLEALGDSNNDTSVNNLLEDLFNLDEADKKILRQKFSDLMQKIFCLLTTNELCKLITGKSVELEVYEEVLRIISVKMPELKVKIGTHDDIRNLFLRIGEIMGQDAVSALCPDLQDVDVFSVSCACDDGTLQAARATLLSDRGLPRDVIDSILNSVYEMEIKNVEDVLKFLESPFDLSNFPKILCERKPDGTLVPPFANLGLTEQEFKKSLQDTIEDVNSMFEKESELWYKTTYSVSSSNPSGLQMIKNGDQYTLQPKQIEEKNANNNEQKTTIYPSYLFSKFLEDIKIVDNSLTIMDTKNEFSLKIDGSLQKSLDVKVIESTLINTANQKQEKFKQFCADIVYDFVVAIFSSLINFENYDTGVKSFNDSLGAYKNPTILKNLGILDSFARRRNSQEDRFKETYKEVLKTSQSINADYLEENGISLYLELAKQILSKRDEYNAVVTLIADIIFSQKDSAGLADPRYNLKNTFITTHMTNFDNALSDYIEVEKYFNIVFNTSLSYPIYDITYNDNVRKNLDINKKYQVSSLNILKNSSPSINIESLEILSDDVSSYISKVLKISSKNPSKHEVFNAYLTKKNASNVGINYKKVYMDFFKSVLKSTKKSLFLSKLKTMSAQEKADPRDKNKKIKTPDVYTPFTNYFQIKSKQTYRQKQCNITPSYIDIEEIIRNASNEAANSACMQQKISDAALNGESINLKDLENVETTGIQNIKLSAIHKMCLRLYLDEIVLRGIPVFAYYDGQQIRSDALFVDYVTSLLEYELKSQDLIYYNMLMNFIVDSYIKQNTLKTDTLSEDVLQASTSDNDSYVRKQIFKNAVAYELKTHCLPKLSKRLLEDTNNNLLIASQNVQNPFKINLKSYFNFSSILEILDQNINISAESLGISYFNSELSAFFVQNNNVYFSTSRFLGLINPLQAAYNTEERIPEYYSQNSSQTFLLSNNSNSFDSTDTEFKLLFEYLFPIKRYITLSYIIASQCALTKPENKNNFRDTKNLLRLTSKIILSGGQPIVADPNDPQQVETMDPASTIKNFILEAMITAPIAIAKSFIETTDPNVQVASTAYKLAKQINESAPSYIIPAVGVPMLYFVASPFGANPLNLLYYALGLWYEEDKKDNKKDLLNNILGQENIDASCEKEKYSELKLNKDFYYTNAANYYKPDESFYSSAVYDNTKIIDPANQGIVDLGLNKAREY